MTFAKIARTRILAAALFIPLLSPLLGWGEVGHRTAGVIASNYVTEKTRIALEDLLGDRTLATAGTWADEMRKDKSYDWAKPLHYVNLPMDATAVDLARDCPPVQNPEGGITGECVLGAIERFSNVLKDANASKPQKSEALKFLIHFIEDLHQPLHVSYAKDRGGNMITVSFLGKPGANLHRVWDTDIIEQRVKQTTDGDWMKWAVALRDAITKMDVARFSKSDNPIDWANESFEITRKLYKDLPNETGNIDADYVNRWIPTVEDRVTAAGVRLANHLNAIFDPATSKRTLQPRSEPTTPPIPPATQPTTAPTPPAPPTTTPAATHPLPTSTGSSSKPGR